MSCQSYEVSMLGNLGNEQIAQLVPKSPVAYVISKLQQLLNKHNM